MNNVGLSGNGSSSDNNDGGRNGDDVKIKDLLALREYLNNHPSEGSLPSLEPGTRDDDGGDASIEPLIRFPDYMNNHALDGGELSLETNTGEDPANGTGVNPEAGSVKESAPRYINLESFRVNEPSLFNHYQGYSFGKAAHGILSILGLGFLAGVDRKRRQQLARDQAEKELRRDYESKINDINSRSKVTCSPNQDEAWKGVAEYMSGILSTRIGIDGLPDELRNRRMFTTPYGENLSIQQIFDQSRDQGIIYASDSKTKKADELLSLRISTVDISNSHVKKIVSSMGRYVDPQEAFFDAPLPGRLTEEEEGLQAALTDWIKKRDNELDRVQLAQLNGHGDTFVARSLSEGKVEKVVYFSQNLAEELIQLRQKQPDLAMELAHETIGRNRYFGH